MKTCVGSRHELQRSEPGNVGKEYGGVRKQVSDRRIVNFVSSFISPSDKNDLRRSLPDVKPSEYCFNIAVSHRIRKKSLMTIALTQQPVSERFADVVLRDCCRKGKSSYKQGTCHHASDDDGLLL
jgi:hypothetical protein